ncbi:hypothetical protein KY289_035117 [Solanum tuberosum]|nr:hypothetical protein KY284_034960 [Solanum tuberosum]KAH0635202.1 hypothetical protein KY289_035117 [Solanum tuberosum]
METHQSLRENRTRYHTSLVHGQGLKPYIPQWGTQVYVSHLVLNSVKSNKTHSIYQIARAANKEPLHLVTYNCNN